MTERDPALEPFEALIGTWATEATHPEVDAVVLGSTTFEWLDRTYRISLDGGELRFWRDDRVFAQRFSARIARRASRVDRRSLPLRATGAMTCR
jgi:hypothetical protein